MADTDPQKAKRLVAFRKLERERASMEVARAKAAVDSAKQAVETQESAVEAEANDLLPEPGQSVQPEDLTLALACLQAARAELGKRKAVLSSAEQTFGQKASTLLGVHKKVRQMEALEAAAKEAQSLKRKTKENKEIDDLAVNREARK